MQEAVTSGRPPFSQARSRLRSWLSSLTSATTSILLPSLAWALLHSK